MPILLIEPGGRWDFRVMSGGSSIRHTGRYELRLLGLIPIHAFERPERTRRLIRSPVNRNQLELPNHSLPLPLTPFPATNCCARPALRRALTKFDPDRTCLLYTSPSPRDGLLSRMPSSA